MLVEFVSANPTGPLTVAGGRHAAFGDSLARVLEFAGHDVEREYYVNDYGTQVELFGRSIAARDDAATSLPRAATRASTSASSRSSSQDEGLDPVDLDALTRRGVELMRRAGARHARALPGAIRQLVLGARAPGAGHASRPALELLERGHVYASEGRDLAAHDRLRRRQGPRAAPLLRRADLLRHRHRLPRRTSADADYDRLINVLGADHHGYVGADQGRLRGARWRARTGSR